MFESDAAALPGVAVSPYTKTNIPRLEAEFVYTKNKIKGWVGGTVQNTKNPDTDDSATATGISGGLRWDNKKLSLTGSGYYGKGLGTTLMFLGASCDTADLRLQRLRRPAHVLRLHRPAHLHRRQGHGRGQLRGEPPQGRGRGDRLGFKTENALISGGLYYQTTKSLKVVFELNYATTKDKDSNAKKNSSFAPAVGLMLFF